MVAPDPEFELPGQGEHAAEPTAPLNDPAVLSKKRGRNQDRSQDGWVSVAVQAYQAVHGPPSGPCVGTTHNEISTT